MKSRFVHRLYLPVCAMSIACCEIAVAAGDLPLKPAGSFDIWRAAFSAIFIAVLCLGVVAIGLYTWRHRIRLQGGGTALPNAAANVEWARRVSPRTTLIVVRWQGKSYLLAENGSTTHVIDSHAVEEPRT